MLARMPTIATVIINSINVNPRIDAAREARLGTFAFRCGKASIGSSHANVGWNGSVTMC